MIDNVLSCIMDVLGESMERLSESKVFKSVIQMCKFLFLPLIKKKKKKLLLTRVGEHHRRILIFRDGTLCSCCRFAQLFILLFYL